MASRLLAEGATYKSRLVSRVSADADYFRKISVEYAKNPDMIMQTLRQDAVRRALESVDQKFVVHRNASGQQEIAARVPIATTGWVAGANRPVSVVMRDVYAGLWIAGGLNLLVAAASAGLAWMTAGNLVHQLRRLRAPGW